MKGLFVSMQVDWDGPSECTFSATLGSISFHGLSAHLNPLASGLRSEPASAPVPAMIYGASVKIIKELRGAKLLQKHAPGVVMSLCRCVMTGLEDHHDLCRTAEAQGC